ncbi:MAG: hypothetical protein JJ863_35840 [Deltaproteobacteria bacterium]|nr:hypothetical protein [Deltaproteobacteria bacterium]
MRALVALVVLGASLTLGADRSPLHPDVRGASLGLFASEPDYDYEAMVAEIANRGASDLWVVDRIVQRDLSASELHRVPGESPSLATVRRTLRQGRERGMRVGLMLIVGLEVRRPGEWRGEIQPTDREEWFASYERHLDALARVAQAEGVRHLVIGSELNGLEPHAERWRSLAASARDHFGGELLYSANWDRYARVPFWDAVDAIGVSAYFRVDGPEGPRAVWDRELAALERFAEGKPVVLTEVGYPAHAEAARYPWDETRSREVDATLQASLLGAFCDAYEARPGAGYVVWNWFGVGGPRDGGYSPRGKPAAQRFGRCMEVR